MRAIRRVIVGAAAAALAVGMNALPARATVPDYWQLSSSGVVNSLFLAVNNNGDAVGQIQPAGDPQVHPFVQYAGQAPQLVSLPPGYHDAGFNDINIIGGAVGLAGVPGGVEAFAWNRGVFQPLGFQLDPTGVDDNGMVAATDVSVTPPRPVLLAPNLHITPLPLGGYSSGTTNRIGPGDVVVGAVSNGTAIQPAKWDTFSNLALSVLPVPAPFIGGNAMYINAAQDIAGVVYDVNGASTGIRWSRDGSIALMPRFGAPWSLPRGINAAGDVSFVTTDGSNHYTGSYLFSGGQVFDENDRMTPAGNPMSVWAMSYNSILAGTPRDSFQAEIARPGTGMLLHVNTGPLHLPAPVPTVNVARPLPLPLLHGPLTVLASQGLITLPKLGLIPPDPVIPALP